MNRENSTKLVSAKTGISTPATIPAAPKYTESGTSAAEKIILCQMLKVAEGVSAFLMFAVIRRTSEIR
jgi:hypothetical protein